MIHFQSLDRVQYGLGRTFESVSIDQGRDLTETHNKSNHFLYLDLQMDSSVSWYLVG